MKRLHNKESLSRKDHIASPMLRWRVLPSTHVPATTQTKGRKRRYEVSILSDRRAIIAWDLNVYGTRSLWPDSAVDMVHELFSQARVNLASRWVYKIACSHPLLDTILNSPFLLTTTPDHCQPNCDKQGDLLPGEKDEAEKAAIFEHGKKIQVSGEPKDGYVKVERSDKGYWYRDLYTPKGESPAAGSKEEPPAVE
ncbi:hypothetical protein HRG_009404 [Hirsutella rhossiliensis]|uniref:Uncharacterized protein n=1 Tax=Hirsutella rhossiliensis TaxID=111463 RepID=A0A9P8MUV1_9HYPO|nr:uncharacterized protein HRG_09404 [Hirsutella rhossiliensis]KAH0959622.1 hypothetical protein HRG_09404 [Hirsutella rhossiliensis]